MDLENWKACWHFIGAENIGLVKSLAIWPSVCFCLWRLEVRYVNLISWKLSSFKKYHSVSNVAPYYPHFLIILTLFAGEVWDGLVLGRGNVCQVRFSARMLSAPSVRSLSCVCSVCQTCVIYHIYVDLMVEGVKWVGEPDLVEGWVKLLEGLDLHFRDHTVHDHHHQWVDILTQNYIMVAKILFELLHKLEFVKNLVWLGLEWCGCWGFYYTSELNPMQSARKCQIMLKSFLFTTNSGCFQYFIVIFFMSIFFI